MPSFEDPVESEILEILGEGFCYPCRGLNWFPGSANPVAGSGPFHALNPLLYSCILEEKKKKLTHKEKDTWEKL